MRLLVIQTRFDFATSEDTAVQLLRPRWLVIGYAIYALVLCAIGVMLGGMGEGSAIPLAVFGSPIPLLFFGTLVTWATFGCLLATRKPVWATALLVAHYVAAPLVIRLSWRTSWASDVYLMRSTCYGDDFPTCFDLWLVYGIGQLVSWTLLGALLRERWRATRSA